MNGYISKPVDYPTLVAAIGKATVLSSPSSAKQGPHSQRFDRAIIDRTLDILPPESAAEHLRSLHDLMQETTRLLEAHASWAELEDKAHALCSAAGMFGFRALSEVSRNFEQAVSSGLTDMEKFARQLAAETSVASEILEDFLAAGRGRVLQSGQLLEVT